LSLDKASPYLWRASAKKGLEGPMRKEVRAIAATADANADSDGASVYNAGRCTRHPREIFECIGVVA
jgi:hypothetical protein